MGCGEGNGLATLKEVAVGLHDRAGSGVESLKETVVELDGGVVAP